MLTFTCPSPPHPFHMVSLHLLQTLLCDVNISLHFFILFFFFSSSFLQTQKNVAHSLLWKSWRVDVFVRLRSVSEEPVWLSFMFCSFLFRQFLVEVHLFFRDGQKCRDSWTIMRSINPVDLNVLSCGRSCLLSCSLPRHVEWHVLFCKAFAREPVMPGFRPLHVFLPFIFLSTEMDIESYWNFNTSVLSGKPEGSILMLFHIIAYMGKHEVLWDVTWSLLWDSCA